MLSQDYHYHSHSLAYVIGYQLQVSPNYGSDSPNSARTYVKFKIMSTTDQLEKNISNLEEIYRIEAQLTVLEHTITNVNSIAKITKKDITLIIFAF